MTVEEVDKFRKGERECTRGAREINRGNRREIKENSGRTRARKREKGEVGRKDCRGER